MQGYLATRGHLACCFTDLKPFLPPLLPPTAAPAATAAAAATPLHAFAASDPPLHAMPFAPLADVGSSSDAAPLAPLFQWSFTLPSALRAQVLGVLQAQRAAQRPDEAMRLSLLRVLAEVHTRSEEEKGAAVAAAAASASAAAAAAAAAAEAELAALIEEEEEALSLDAKKGGGKKAGGKKGKGGGAAAAAAAAKEPAKAAAAAVAVAAAAAPPPTSTAAALASSTSTPLPPPTKFDRKRLDPLDPHGVRGVLSPPSLLDYTRHPPAAALITAARSRVRAYSTAVQCLRYLGALRGGGSAAEAAEAAASGASQLLPRSGCRAAVAELCSAWAAALPLHTASGRSGGEKDVGEGDELLLAAVQCLWEEAFHAMGVAAAAAAGAAAGPEAPPHPATASAHALLLEAVALLAQGASQSPYNAQFHLAALRTAGWLAGASSSLNAWLRLRIKHVLLDSLGHLALRALGRLCWSEALAKQVLGPLTGMGGEVSSEVPRYLAVALGAGNLSSGVDMVRMKGRVRDSGLCALGRCTAAGLGVGGWGGACRTPGEAGVYLGRCLQGGGEGGGGSSSSSSSTSWSVTEEALARLRDSSDRCLPSCWDAPAGLALAAVRGLWQEPSSSRGGSVLGEAQGTIAALLQGAALESGASSTPAQRVLAALSPWRAGGAWGARQRCTSGLPCCSTTCSLALPPSAPCTAPWRAVGQLLCRPWQPCRTGCRLWATSRQRGRLARLQWLCAACWVTA